MCGTSAYASQRIHDNALSLGIVSAPNGGVQGCFPAAECFFLRLFKPHGPSLGLLGCFQKVAPEVQPKASPSSRMMRSWARQSVGCHALHWAENHATVLPGSDKAALVFVEDGWPHGQLNRGVSGSCFYPENNLERFQPEIHSSISSTRYRMALRIFCLACFRPLRH